MTDTYAAPSNVEAEQWVIGSVLKNPIAVGSVQWLRPEDFYDRRYRAIWRAALDLWERAVPIDYGTLSTRLKADDVSAAKVGLADLTDIDLLVPSAAHVEHYARMVAAAATQRRYISAAQRIAESAYKPGCDIEALVIEAEAILATARPSATRQDLLDPERWSNAFWDDLSLRLEGKRTAVSTGLLDLDDMTLGLEDGRLYLLMGTTGTGKALAIDTPLATPTGWTTMGEIQPGDMLFDERGQPTRVLFATPVMHGRPCYEVTFSDGSTIVADAEHQWLTRTSRERNVLRRRVQEPTTKRSAWQRIPTDGLRTTAEVGATLSRRDGGLNHAVMVSGSIDTPDGEFPVPPYVLGAWLGDGTSRTSYITSADVQVLDEIRREGVAVGPPSGKSALRAAPAYPLGGRSRSRPRATRLTREQAVAIRETPALRGSGTALASEYGISGSMVCAIRNGRAWTSPEQDDSLQQMFRRLGVLDNKHIPPIYLRGSTAQRLALLQGLMDTDGTCSVGGQCSYSSTSQRLADDAYELVCSLGIKATLTSKPCKGRRISTSTAYSVNFTTSLPVFRLDRKRARQATTTRETQRYRYVSSVRRIDSVPVRCIQVDSPSHLYLAGRSFIPTHNSELALQVAIHVAKQHGAVLFASLEMTAVELAQRYARITQGLDRNRLAVATGLSEEEWARVAEVVNEMQGGRLWTATPRGPYTTSNLRADAMEVQARQGKCAMIVTDYVQLFRDVAGKYANREQNIGMVAENLKRIAREFGCPVLAPVQPNRDHKNRPSNPRPLLTDLRDSGQLENTADVVLGLYRDEKHNPESRDRGVMEVHMLKNRSGAGDDHGARRVVWRGHHYDNYAALPTGALVA